ncbi:MAG: hypothetical protein ACYTG5_09250 [Planctomycetota bacterium]|jgi:hypothetical protein
MRGLVISLLFVACQQPEPVPDPYQPRAVELLAQYQVRAQGAVIGRVLEVEIKDPVWPETRYRVENLDRQWLGFIDAKGGVYKRVPFELEEKFLGIYPMEEGLALLFETEEPPAIDRKPVKKLP